jgi:3-oxo-5-alpha-steroid 4-dehydrogenase 1
MIRTIGNILAMGYSKLQAMKGIPTRAGMTLTYGSPLVALIAGASPYLFAPDAYQMVVFAVLCGHFIKRLLESWFLHKYSRPANPLTTVAIACFYSLTSFFPAYINRQPISEISLFVYTGLGVFLIGETLNFVHHKILADVRPATMAYVIPHGGLFDFVACPHYLFELVSWFGLVLIFRHYSMLLFFSLMVLYLTIRSLVTLKWYRERFPDFPPDRKAILLFIL